MDFHHSIAGLLVGFLVGMTGMGGSSLMAPILIFVFHYKTKYAIGSDLAYAAIAKVFGAWHHQRHGKVNLPLVGYMSLGSVPASLVGVWLLHRIDLHGGAHGDRTLTRILGAVLLLVGAILFVRSVPAVENWIKHRRENRPPLHPGWAVLLGAVGGLLVGLTSVGSGTLFGAILLLFFGLGSLEMVGTDLLHAALLSAVAALGHVWAGDVDYTLVASLLLGAVPGVLAGSLVATRVPERILRPTVATVLLVTGMKVFA